MEVDYSSVEERDMDTLFLEALGSDKKFATIFTSKIEKLQNQDFEILSIKLSLSDTDGESDITVILESDGKKYGLLIEDKINASAMNEQCSRYLKRGETGKINNDYEEFFVFIVCPKKYYEANAEAKKYENHVFYEECKEYLESKSDVLSNIWVQQITQALVKLEKGYNGTYDSKRVKFLEDYIKYQKENYRDLSIANNVENAHVAGWVRYNVPLKDAYIIHKAEKEFMDLTFSNKTEKEANLKLLAKKLQLLGCENLLVENTGKSIAFRIKVPKINFNEDFKFYENTKELKECFEAAEKLTDIATMIKLFGDLSS